MKHRLYSNFYQKSHIVAGVLFIVLFLPAALLLVPPRFASAGVSGPVVRLDPANLEISKDSAGAANIQIEAISNLYGVDLRLTFDPNIVAVVDADPDTPGVQIEVGALFAGRDHFVARNNVENGVIEFVASLREPAAPINGSGPAATITWRGKAVGQTSVIFTQSKLADPDGNPLSHTPQDGAVKVIDNTVKISGTALLQARADHSDTGIFLSEEACSVSAGAAGVPIPDAPDTVTDAGGYFQLGVPANRTYQCLQAFQPGYLIGQCSNPSGDLGAIELLGGDVTEDDIIDIFDLAYIASRYGGSDPTADVNADGVVDIFDLVITAGNYGQSGPVAWPSCSSSPLLPDLIVNSMKIGPQTGDPCRLGMWVDVANTGQADAGSFTVEANSSQQLTVPGLKAGHTVSVWLAGAGHNGQNTAFVDAAFQVTESSETNNQLSRHLIIPTPAPACIPTPVPLPTPTPSLGCAPAPVASVTVGDTPRGLAVDSTRNRVYAANYGSNSVSVIDSHSNAVIQTIPNINAANGIAYDPANNIVWVSNYSANQVTPIRANAAADHFTVLPPIAVGRGPWGVAYDPAHNYVYVVNNVDNSVTVIDAGTRAVVATLSGQFDQPFHLAANPLNGKVYVVNFGSGTVAVLNGTTVSKVEQLYTGQIYGVAVDETRDVVYVSAISGHRIVALGDHPEHGPDSFLGWAEFFRGFHDRHRPLPMRVIAVNPAMGDPGDGGHLWTTTSTADGSEGNQVLLIRKGWSAYFHYPTTADVAPNPGEGMAIDRAKNRVYVSGGASPGVVTVLGDSHHPCAHPASNNDTNFIDFEVFINDGR